MGVADPPGFPKIIREITERLPMISLAVVGTVEGREDDSLRLEDADVVAVDIVDSGEGGDLDRFGPGLAVIRGAPHIDRAILHGVPGREK